MKRTLLTLFSFALLIPSAVASLEEYYTYNGHRILYYTYNDSTIMIKEWDANALGELIIPRTIDGKEVTSIGFSAFSNCSSLTSVTIPESVTEIGGNAFRDCSSLTSLTVPKGVTVIEGLAFAGCESLISVTIPEGVTDIAEGADL